MKKWRYGNVFIYSSFQFSGNIEEYFSKNSRKLIAFIILPRIKNEMNFIRVYKKGKLVRELKVKLSENVFLYYILWFYHYIKCLMMFDKKSRVIVLGTHPITFFGMVFQKMLRRITFVFWICDYFPGDGFIIKSYERLKKHYHDVIPFSCYLSDEINRVFNGDVIDSKRRKTVMWGVKPQRIIQYRKKGNGVALLFVGVIREQQGLESLFSYLKTDSNSKLFILGACEENLYKRYKKMIRKFGIGDQIYFPNENVYHKELEKYASKSDIGIAIYDTGKLNVTYYADPAKIKTYTQYGLPVIMTRISSIAPIIEKFKAGLVVERDEDSLREAILKIKMNYQTYTKGVVAFNNYFNFEKYYKSKFKFLE